MPYQVQMWRTSWPVFIDDVVGLFVGCDDGSWSYHPQAEVLGWASLLEEQDDITQNFMSVLGGGYAIPSITSKAIFWW